MRRTVTAYTYFSLGDVKGFNGQEDKGIFEACVCFGEPCTSCLRGGADTPVLTSTDGHGLRYGSVHSDILGTVWLI